MNYRPGNVARWGIALVIPVVGGALASYRELVWGAAAVAALVAAPPLRRYAAAAGVAFGLLVLARVAAAVAAGGVVAVFLGFAAVIAVAYLLSLRRRAGEGAATTQWATALAAVCAVAAAGAAVLFAGPPTLNLMLVPLAAFAAMGAIPAGGQLYRGAFIALVIGLALGSVKGGVSFGLARAAEEALARGDYGDAGRYARYAAAGGAGARADLTGLKAAAEGGASWPELEAVYADRDPFSSPRPFDAALAAAALTRGYYEKAAMYGDLAATPSPTAGRDKPLPPDELYDLFAGGEARPFDKAWATLWAGRYEKAAAAFAALKRREPRTAWYEAFALERAGRKKAAAVIYKKLWDDDRTDFRAAFGLLRTGKYLGLRGEIWRNLGKRYGQYFVGTELDAADGFPLTKRRLSLGRKAATLTFDGGGSRPIAVIAESYAAQGLYPIVTLTVNGNPARTFYMNVPGEDIYETSVALGAGENRIGLIFENDFADPGRGLDRNVYVREVRIGGENE
jgi:tetratricopeptide (TPR) repeat protein